MKRNCAHISHEKLPTDYETLFEKLIDLTETGQIKWGINGGDAAGWRWETNVIINPTQLYLGTDRELPVLENHTLIEQLWNSIVEIHEIESLRIQRNMKKVRDTIHKLDCV